MIKSLLTLPLALGALALPLSAATTFLDFTDAGDWDAHATVSPDGECYRHFGSTSGLGLADGDTIVFSMNSWDLGNPPGGELIGVFSIQDLVSPKSSFALEFVNGPLPYTGTIAVNDGGSAVTSPFSFGTNPLTAGNNYSVSYTVTYSDVGNFSINTVLFDNTAGVALLNSIENVSLPGFDPSLIALEFRTESLACIKDPSAIPEPSRTILVIAGLALGLLSRTRRTLA